MLLVITATIIVVGMASELLYARWSGRRLYGLGDTVVDVSALAFEQTFMVLAAAPAYALYMAVYHFRLVPRMSGWLSVVVALVGVDLGFYVWHRLSHRVMIMWWGHSVHHSSEEFNVAVAIRMSGWALMTQRFFYLPLALLGVPVEAMVLADGISGIYALLIHNRVVGKLGFIEWIFVTPSHHRVHHARNPEYLDKNYGEMLIIWDRLLGTFAEEVTEPVYGLRHPLETHNILWARFHILFEIGDRMRRAKGVMQKLLAPFRPPEWDPAGMHDVSSPAVSHVALASAATGNTRRYAIAQHVVLFAAVGAFMATASHLGWWQRVGLALWIWASFGVLGALLDARRWAPRAEALRWMVAAAGVFVLH